MAPTLDQLLASPDFYLHSFEGDAARFVAMDPPAYRRSIFLDRRIQPATDGLWHVPVAALAGQLPEAQPIRWIFHVAHCGSTLLARALEVLTDDLVLREPLALRQVALEPDADRLAIALALLSRRYPGQGPVTVKANVPVNFILDALSEAQTQAPAIFLYAELDDYLLAILRSPNHRAWLRNVTGLLAPHLGDLSALQDAELGAVLWLAMRRRYAAALARMPKARSLDAERFFGDPQAVLAATAGLFGIDADPAAVAAVTSGPLFGTYSKNPAHAFDNAARLARRDALAVELAGELQLAQSWIARNAADASAIEAQLAAVTLIA
jgi:hypothetical protein